VRYTITHSGRDVRQAARYVYMLSQAKDGAWNEAECFQVD
jgi:hypothetical protein